MKKRFQPCARPPASRAPPGRGLADRFTGAPKAAVGCRAAGVAPRPPPRNQDDISCVNCGRTGHMVADCRQPKAEQGQRPCFTCRKPRHLARNCPNNPVKAPTATGQDHGAAPQPFATMCVTTVDADGFATVTRPRPRPMTTTIQHFIPQITDEQQRRQQQHKHRYRPLTVDDWLEVAESPAEISQGEMSASVAEMSRRQR